jgi:hypothetical protein
MLTQTIASPSCRPRRLSAATRASVLDDHRAALPGRVDSLVAEAFDDVAEERPYLGVRLADEDLHRTHHRAPTARISAGSGMEAV